MSLFENDAYQWRETFFILFRDEHQPLAADVKKALRRIDGRFEIRDIKSDEAGRLESLTVECPDDYSAMDISLVRGDEVPEQTAELTAELLKSASTAEEKKLIKQLLDYRCRYDIYHFEQLVFVGRSDEDEENDDFMDPGAVLAVMQKLAQMCHGIAVDPQANAIIS
jgi:hypothetical protein